ncbi:hypothetical protein TNCV_4466561 [Trichonephila clavipes]|nr:hypothetical protein TNCV_4466561 [Trichonephila clavipes]
MGTELSEASLSSVQFSSDVTGSRVFSLTCPLGSMGPELMAFRGMCIPLLSRYNKTTSRIVVIVTDTTPIIHPTFIELAFYRRQHQWEYSTPFSRVSKSAPYPSTVGSFSCTPARELSGGRPCEGDYLRSCGSERPHTSYID